MSQDNSSPVKKPLTAFIIWSREVRQTPSGIRNIGELSKYLGMRWNAMSDKEKEPYFKEQSRQQNLHKRENPGYVFRPNRIYGKKLRDAKSTKWTSSRFGEGGPTAQAAVAPTPAATGFYPPLMTTANTLQHFAFCAQLLALMALAGPSEANGGSQAANNKE